MGDEGTVRRGDEEPEGLTQLGVEIEKCTGIQSPSAVHVFNVLRESAMLEKLMTKLIISYL
jgi:hypothetical protein